MIQMYKRGDTWHYSFMLNGRRIRRTSKRTKKSEAHDVALAHRQRLLNEIQFGASEDITIGEGLERFLASREKPSAIAAAKYNIRKLLKGHEGGYRMDPDMPISALRNEHLDRIKASRKRTGLSNSSINQELKCLQTMVNMARRKKWGVRLPQDLVFEMEKVQSKKRYLTADEERRLLEELDPMRVGAPGLAPIGDRNEDLNQCLHDNYDLTVFLLDTGCRWGEATVVQWTVVDTKNWDHILIHRPKVSNFDTLALTDRLREILQRRYQNRKSVYVFPSRTNPDQPRGYSPHAIQKAIDRAGLNDPERVKSFGRFTIHSLRASFVTKILKGGASLYDAQLLLGHTTSVMTQRYSQMVAGDAAKRAVEILNGQRVE